MKKIAMVLSIILTIFALVGCAGSKPAAAEWNDGTFTGTGKGFKGDMEVEVVISGGKITDVNVLSHKDTVGFSDPAIEEVPKAIIKAQKTEIDVATGATATENGIIEAVNAALGKAKK
jgi:uncharacterized protein with FMN-binding domain